MTGARPGEFLPGLPLLPGLAARETARPPGVHSDRNPELNQVLRLVLQGSRRGREVAYRAKSVRYVGVSLEKGLEDFR